MPSSDGRLPWLREAPDFAAPASAPAHMRIERWLATQIARGRLRDGDRLPREDSLAATLGVSRMTLRQALATLESRGAVERRPGRGGGTFVTTPRFDCDLTGLTGFTEQMRRSHVRVGARLVGARTVPADVDVAAALDLAPGDPVHVVVRVRTAQRRPVALERSWLPAAVFPGLLEHPMSGSVYRILARDYDRAPHSADERLSAVAASPDDAARLEVPAGSPLMRVERTVRDVGGVAIEHATDLFRPDRVRISLRTGVGSPAQVDVDPPPG